MLTFVIFDPSGKINVFVILGNTGSPGFCMVDVASSIDIFRKVSSVFKMGDDTSNCLFFCNMDVVCW
jgi:hypothetical protein